MTAPDRQATLEVTGMTCEACEHHVADALTKAGAVDASADFRRGVAGFAWPDSVTEEGLRGAVTEAGYTPGQLTADEPGLSFSGRDDVDYDLVIVGSGGAAFAAAIRATTLGARVAIVERGKVGGTCVNVGCVPSKTLLAAAGTYHGAGHHPFAGVPTTTGSVDFASVIAQKDELVAGLQQAKYLDLADDYGFEVIQGTARFTGPDTLDVDGRSLRAGAFMVGPVPNRPSPTSPAWPMSTTLPPPPPWSSPSCPRASSSSAPATWAWNSPSSSPAWAATFTSSAASRPEQSPNWPSG